MATTPPPPSFLRMPPTPRHGTGYDQYEPYSTRHSARIASQRASAESRATPPPSFPTSQGRGGSRSAKKQKTSESETLSPPGSPNTSPQKKMSAHPATQAFEGPDSSDPFDTTKPAHNHRTLHPFRATTMMEGMLPTPAKTPRKKTVDNLGSTARALFPPPSGPKKKTKKHTGFSLDSFTDDPTQGESQIQIYTDSRDRIPELDESEENPFYKKPVPNHTNARTSRRKPVSRDKGVDAALKREDGMVYVFRGKKMFRKFTDDAGSDEELDDDDLGLLASRPDLMDSSLLENTRPLTRSSIKPRVLFPGAHDRTLQKTHPTDVDEEAATDIEDHVLADANAEEDMDHAVHLPSQAQRSVTPQPTSNVATPPSPGASLRSLRPRPKRDGLESGRTPTAPEPKKKRISPFDGWLRKKQTPPVISSSKSKKRDAETTGSPGGPASKRTRSSRATTAS